MRARGVVGLLVVLLAVGAAAGASASQAPPGAEDAKDAPDPEQAASEAKSLAGSAGDGGSGGGDGGGSNPSDPAGPGPVEVDPGRLADTVGFGGAIMVLASIGAAGGALYGGARLVSDQELLENETREAIYRYLEAEVGANLKELTEALDLTTTNAIWHLRKLEEGDLVRSEKFNGYRIFYPAEGGQRAKRITISKAALSNDNAREIFEYITANPGAHQRKIARALDVNHGTVRWHLKKLRKADLLDEVDAGRASEYFPTEVGEEVISTLETSSEGAATPS
jgi:DNA-binding transcriptional ArsR family regulator